MAFGERAKLIEASGDGRHEAAGAGAIRTHKAIDRRRHLIGAVRAAKTLHGDVGTPAGLKDVMRSPLLVFRATVSVIAGPGAAGLAEDQHIALAVLERIGVCFALDLGPLLDDALLVPGDNAGTPARHLGHPVDPIPFNNHVERVARQADR